MSTSRRRFLQDVSAATAAGLLIQLPARRLWAAPITAAPAASLPEIDEALLRQLANVAVEAARAAGAAFADVRVTAGQSIKLGCEADFRQGGTPVMGWPNVTVETAYGIRAVVDGGIGFASGGELTPDAVRAVAQQAVVRARGNRPRQPRPLVLAPVPYADQGTWATPIAQDPFGVPVDAQLDLIAAALAAAGRVKGVARAGVEFRWNRHVRVFASSEGALLTQRVAIAVPTASVVASGAGAGLGAALEEVPALRRGPWGYETVTRIDLRDELRQAAERAVEAARQPAPRSVEVGRYDLVVSAPAMGALLAGTVAEALNLERALGYRANDPFSGTSFAAPPRDMLGQYQVASSLLTLTADRTRPNGGATVRWDDEGIRAGGHTLVQDGIIVDYLTNRRTAVEIADWYTAQGEPVGSRGCASGAGRRLPRVNLPNLTMAPGRNEVAVDDLIADTKRGLYIEELPPYGSSDPQVLNQLFWVNDGQVREIRNGKLGERLRDVAFQFITPVLWRGMEAIGGSRSAVETLQYTGHSETRPIYLPYASVRTVPAWFREVTVLNTGRGE